jgi:hypothetical protein
MPPAKAREEAPPPPRPLRAATPRSEGPPVWLIAAFVLGGAIVAFFFLR